MDAQMKKWIQEKASTNTPMDIVTPEKQKYYNEYQNYLKGEIQKKALSGRQLDSPTEWKNSLYQQYQQEPINNMFGQYQDMLNKMYDSQRESQLAQLRASQQKAVGQLNQQKAELAPQYQSARNQTDATNLQNIQQLREAMAASGLGASGENVTANVGMNNARLGSLNQLNLQEQQAINDINRQISDVNDPMQEQALLTALEAQRMQAVYDAFNNAQNIGYQRLRDTIGDNRYYDERDYSRERDKVADQRYQQEWDYQKMWDERRWNELPPAERLAAQLDYEYYLKKQAASRSGGGGRSSGGSSSGGSTSQSSLSNAYQQFQQEKSKSGSAPVDQYYNAMESIFKPIPRKEPVYPIPSIGSNANLSNYDRLQMIKQQYGIR